MVPHLTRAVLDFLLTVLKVAPLVFLGFFAASMMMRLRVHERLGRLIGDRAARWGLTPEAASALAASLVSPSASYPMLAELHREGRLDDRDVILLVVATTLPTTIGELFIKGPFFAALAILGPRLGLEYVGALLLSALIQTVPALLLYGRRRDRSGGSNPDPVVSDPVRPRVREALAEALRRAGRRMAYVLPRMLGVGAAMVVLAELIRWRVHGGFGPVLATIVANLSHYTVGYATVAEFVRMGTLSEREAVATLLIAGCANVLMIFLRASLATYVSIFGGRLGVKVWSANLGSSLAARLLVAGALLLS